MKSVKTTSATVTVQAIPFDSFAQAIINAHIKADRVSEKLRDTIVITMQQFIDANAQANGRTEASCKALQQGIKDSECANNSVAMGMMEAKTWTEYAQAAARALYWDVPFAPSLKNNSELALPWGKKSKSGAAPKAGKVETTDMAALHATLSKALKQARMLNQLEFAAEMLDVILATYPEFKESAE